ncbi:hypothetical protein V8G54_008605 [Vigna mungo]|uniref:Uncharacterized protein n=1 Tax=Vigna mungo TaxID=3915 RepID=A0AAQ3P4I6_VIGMU
MCDILWQDSENFVDHGIQIEPFNLAGNFVEYVRENEIKGPPDLSSKDIVVVKRRIANVLEHGETLTEDAMKLMENGEYSSVNPSGLCRYYALCKHMFIMKSESFVDGGLFHLHVGDEGVNL